MKVLVAEAKWTGHHLFFARDIAEALVDSEHQIILDVTADTSDLPQKMLDLALDGIDPRIEIHRNLQGPPTGFSRVRDRDGEVEANAIRSSQRKHRPDVLVLPSADAIAFHLGRRRGDPIDGESTRMVLHQAYVGYDGQGPRFALRREIARRRYRRLSSRLAALDHRIVVGAAKDMDVTVLPHLPAETPTIDRAAARDEFDLDEDDRIFLAAGEHSQRKGTHHLIACWPEDSDTMLLVVGRCSEEIHRAIDERRSRSPGDRIRIIDGAIDAETYNNAFSAADVVTVCYPRHFGASGVLCGAIAYRRPVLGSDYGCIGDTIRSFGLGTAVDCRDSTALRNALSRATTTPPTIDESLLSPLADFQTRSNLRGTIRTWVFGGGEPAPVPFPFENLR